MNTDVTDHLRLAGLLYLVLVGQHGYESELERYFAGQFEPDADDDDDVTSLWEILGMGNKFGVQCGQ